MSAAIQGSDRGPAIVGFVADITAIDRQRRDLEAAGATLIFSMADGTLSECMARLVPGDLLAVTGPEAVAATPAGLLSLRADLAARDIGLAVLSLAGQTVDFTSPASEPTVAMLAAVAAWERAAYVDRRQVGIAAAKASGRFTGRRPTIQTAEVHRRLEAGAKAQAVASELGISRASVYRIAALGRG
jgi:DNA invertase Pin-like site-specific DNA recombinase